MSDIINKAEKHVTYLLNTKLNENYLFHTLQHTKETVKAVQLIGKNSGLLEKELEFVTLAALFHDTGHIYTYDGHEEKSVQIACQFLNEHSYPLKDIDKITACILSTKMYQEPKNILEEIMKDSDIIHIGKRGSLKKGYLLRQELANILNKTYSNLQWLEIDKNFYSSTKFYTNYVRSHYNKGRIKNLGIINKELTKIKKNAL